MLSGQRKETFQSAGSVPNGGNDEQPVTNGRAQRSRATTRTNGWTASGSHIEGYNEVDEMDEESEAESSGNEWDGGDEDANDFVDDDEMSHGNSSTEDEFGAQQSLVVQLRYGKGKKADSIERNLNGPDLTTRLAVKMSPYLQESTVPGASIYSPDKPLLSNTPAISRADSRDVVPETKPEAPALSRQPIFHE